MFYAIYSILKFYYHSIKLKNSLPQTDRPTDRPTDRQTDIVTYRAAIAAKNIRISMKKKKFGDPPSPLQKPILTGKWGNLVKTTLQTHVPKISASADGGLSGGFRVCGRGSEDPHQR